MCRYSLGLVFRDVKDKITEDKTIMSSEET